MRLPLTLSLVLTGGVLAGLPAVTTAQDPTQEARLQLSTPLPTGCYSNPVSGLSGGGAGSVVLPKVGLTGGPAGQRFTLYALPTGPVLGGEPGHSTGRFDANGNAATAFTLASFLQPGPGRTYKLMIGVGPNGSQTPEPSDLPHPFQKELGMVTFAAYSVGIEKSVTDRNGIRRQGKPYRVVVSGAPLAHKTLYGFLVKEKQHVVKQVLKRFKLGTADACGYATGNAVVWPRDVKSYGSLSVYVNAGPKLDKARALKTRV